MLEKEIKQIWEDNILDYSSAVNQSRAIPDARTGLKPIHRKIIYEMYADKILSNKEFKKCAYMVGQIIARFSEHGDQATYDALTRMAQPWIQRYPMLTFHGNAGSQFGDPPAAMRYTEAKLSQLAEEGFLATLKEDTVDWMPNFTNEEDEPTTLPAVFPGLFCLPNQGIGFAVASNFLTFNLNDVADMITHYIQTQELKTIYYDLASGGTFINPSIMKQIYSTGKGSIIIDAKYEVKKNKIIFTEIPFNVMLEDLIENIAKLCEKEELKGIKKIYNDSGKSELRLVVECIDENSTSRVIEQLYRKTSLRNSYGINQVALINNKPKLLSTKEMVDIYIEHNLNCIKREYSFKERKNAARIEILEGLKKALEDIDNIVQLIKTSSSASVAKEKLISTYSFTENQAKAILDMKLARLANLEKVEINKELEDCLAKEQKYSNIITLENEQKKILISRLSSLASKYGDKRRTEVRQKEIKKEEKEIEFVEPEKVVVILDGANNIKRVAATSFKLQRRNTKGTKSASDIVQSIVRTDTIDNLLLFSNKGKMYKLLVDKIPAGTNASKGVPINSLIELASGEYITTTYSLSRENTFKYIFYTTKQGLVKKVPLTEYSKMKKNCSALRLKENDEVISAVLINEENIIILTERGMSIHFQSTEVPISTRTSGGIKGITLKENDIVCTALPIRDSKDTLAIFNQNGTGKRVDLKELTLQKRSGKGAIISKEAIATGCLVSDKDHLLILGNTNSITIAANEISLLGKTANGVNIIKNNQITGVCKV